MAKTCEKTEHQYVYVIPIQKNNKKKRIHYRIQINNKLHFKTLDYSEENKKSLAKKVDLLLIENGREPVNILKRK